MPRGRPKKKRVEDVVEAVGGEVSPKGDVVDVEKKAKDCGHEKVESYRINPRDYYPRLFGKRCVECKKTIE